MQKTKVVVHIITCFLLLNIFLICNHVNHSCASEQDIYVDDDQRYPGEADGSLYNPYYTIQDAIDAVEDGDTIKILPATERLRSDFVLVPIVVNDDLNNRRMVILDNQLVRLEQLLYWLDLFTGSYLLLEVKKVDDKLQDGTDSREIQLLKDMFRQYFCLTRYVDNFADGCVFVLFGKSGAGDKI